MGESINVKQRSSVRCYLGVVVLFLLDLFIVYFFYSSKSEVRCVLRMNLSLSFGGGGVADSDALCLSR